MNKTRFLFLSIGLIFLSACGLLNNGIGKPTVPVDTGIRPQGTDIPTPEELKAPLAYVMDFGARNAPGQLESPSALIVSPDNEIVVADTMNRRLEWFSSDGQYLKELSVSGALAYDFALGADENWYIVNGWSEKVFVVSKDGELLKTFGGWSEPISNKSKSEGFDHIALGADGSIYLAKSRGDQVIILNPDGSLSKIWDGPDKKPFKDIMAISVDENNNLYVVSDSQNRVVKRNQQGSVDEFELDDPVAISPLADGSFYVSSQTAIQYRNLKGDLIRQWEVIPGAGIADLTVAPDGSVFILRYGLAFINQRDMLISHYNASGELLKEFGTTRLQPGQFDSHSAFSPSPRGDIWLVDTGNSFSPTSTNARLVHLDSSGKYINGFERLDDYQLSRKQYYLAALADQTVFIAIPDEARILHVSADGHILQQLGQDTANIGQFDQIRAIVAATDEQSIYVVNAGNCCVTQWDLHGRMLAKWEAVELGVQEPIGLAFDSAGNFYLLDGATRQIVVRSSVELIRTWKLPDPKHEVFSIAIDAQRGRVYVGNGDISLFVFGTDGMYLGKTSISDSRGTMVGVDGSGRVYVSQGFKRIAVFDPVP